MFKRLLISVLGVLLLVGVAFAGVNINTADVKELEGLPGIGPAKAQAIVDYRKEHGPFATVDDLSKVQGIGPKMLEQLRDQIEVGKSTKKE